MHAWGFAAWTVALGVTTHVLAGGLPPSGAVTVLLVAVVALLVRSLADRELGLGEMLAAALAVQAGVHVALLDSGAGHSEPGPLMLAGHLALVVVLACWLRCAEAARWRTLRLGTSRVRAVLALLEPVPAQPSTAPRARSSGRRAVLRPAPALMLPDGRGPPARCG